jgi:hypothetical protein
VKIVPTGSTNVPTVRPTVQSTTVDGVRPEAVEHLRGALQSGRPWADVLLEAVGLWTAPHEEYQGRRFTYLLQGEALDWLTVAERLLMEVPEALSREERERLLFHSKLPEHVTEQQFKQCLGVDKYRAHLNFFYGVIVEEALMQAVELEALKESRARGFTQGRGVDILVAERLYGDEYGTLLAQFRNGDVKGRKPGLDLGEWKAFIYWLHKLRLERSDQARTASDTRKGLRQLQRDAATHLHWAPTGLQG